MSVLPSVSAFANPTDGVVSAGSANIVNGDKTVDVIQQSDRAVIDWRSFNIGVDEQTRFYQPNANSIIVNRVNDVNPSSILGSLQANGNVVLINPNGVFFGKNAVVDVNGMLATTADIDNNDFMAGSNSFNKASKNIHATISNEGQISAKDAGLIGLVAPNVINDGVINAKLGRVELASGDTLTVDFRGNGLTEIAVSDDVKSQMVKNTGVINAAGGTIAITAAAGKNIVNSLIDIKGELKAPAVAQHHGKIYIYAGSANKKSHPAHVVVQAKLDVSGRGNGEAGGDISILGDDVTVKSGSVVDASGDLGGGNILIGGDLHGEGVVPTSLVTNVEVGTSILNNALTLGSGGKTIIWSDGTTNFAGNIEGKGGALGGKGGFVETSGKENLSVSGNVDLRAWDGSVGNWLLDPTNITIYNRNKTGTDNVNTITTSYLETQSATSNITLTATNDIILDLTAGFTPDTLNLASNRDLTLSAGHDITSVSSGTIKTNGTGSITLSAGHDVTVASNVTFNSANSITVISDRMSGTPTYVATNDLILRPLTNDTTVGIGSGVGDLSISEALLNNLTYGSLWIGGYGNYGDPGFVNDAGYMTISTTRTFNGNLNLVGQSNVEISDGTITMAANKNFNVLTYGNVYVGGTPTVQTSGTGSIHLKTVYSGMYWGSPITLSATGSGDILIDSRNGMVFSAFQGINFTTNTGNITINTDGMNFNDPVHITSTSGNVTINSDILLNDSDTTISAGTGKLTVQGIDAQNYNLTLIANDLDITGDLTGSGTLTLQQGSTTRGIRINDGADDNTSFYLSTSDLGHLKDGWSTVNVGRSDSTATMFIGASTWVDPVVFLTSVGHYVDGNLTGTGNASISLSGGWANIRNTGTTIATAGQSFSTSGSLDIEGNNEAINTSGGTVAVAGNLRIRTGATAFGITTSNGNLNIGSMDEFGTTTGNTVTLSAGTGTIAFNGIVNGAYNLTASAATITMGGAWGGTTALGNVSLTSTNSISLPAIKAASVLVKTTGATASVTTTGQITTTAAGDALVLSGHSFNNSFGATALNVTNSGRFLVWTADPSLDNRNGISYVFKKYNATYGVTTVLGSGNGFLYTLAPTVTVSLQGTVDKTYNGTDAATLTGSNYTVSAGVGGDTLVVNGPTSGTYNDKNAGNNKNVSVSGITLTASNGAVTVYGYQYNTTANANVGNVAKANVTVTAGSTTKTYGDTISFAGSEFTNGSLFSGDSITSVTLNSAGAAATANASGTPYAIVASNASGTGLSNYNITYVDGGLTVNKANLTVTASNNSKNYGDVITLGTTGFTTNGLLNSDNVTGVTLNSTGNTATATVAGGPYDIVASNASGSGLSNYNITYVDGHLTVNAIALTITASDQTKTYGQTKTFIGSEFNSSGLINGDHISAISLASSGAAAATSASMTPYSIVGSSASGTGLSNYIITYVDGGLTVNKANLTVTANDKTKDYGQTLTFTGSEFTTSGLFNSDTVSSVSLNSTGASSGAAGGASYNIVASNAIGTGLSNYSITYVNGNLVVGALPAPSPVVTIPSNPLPTTVTYTSQNPTNVIAMRSDGITSSSSTQKTGFDGYEEDKHNKTRLAKAVNNLVEIDPQLQEQLNEPSL